MKTCTKCLDVKPLVKFNKGPSFKDGLQSWCKLCMKEYKKKYRVKNKELISTYNQEYNTSNKEKVLKVKSDYQKNNRAKINQHLNIRYKEDSIYKLRLALRRRFKDAIKGNYKSGSAVRDLGCSIEFLKQYLESRFQKGMTWGNYSKWHIDHMRPLSSFDLTKREELLQACHHTNLQPLWAKENLKKGSKQWV